MLGLNTPNSACSYKVSATPTHGSTHLEDWLLQLLRRLVKIMV